MGEALSNIDELELAVLEVVETDIGKLQRFELLKADIVSVDLLSGPLLMRDFITAYVESAKIAAKVRGWLENAEVTLKHEAAKAVLERAPTYFKANRENLEKLKDSKSLRDAYLFLDEEYLKAQQGVSALKAMVRILDNKTESFKMAHDDVKKIYSQLMGGPGVNNGYRGMPSGGNLGDNNGD